MKQLTNGRKMSLFWHFYGSFPVVITAGDFELAHPSAGTGMSERLAQICRLGACTRHKPDFPENGERSLEQGF